MMTSVVRLVMSLGRYCIRLTQDGIDQLFVAPETGLENVQDCRYGVWQLTGIGCFLSGASSWVLDRSAQPAQMQYPGGECGSATGGDPTG